MLQFCSPFISNCLYWIRSPASCLSSRVVPESPPLDHLHLHIFDSAPICFLLELFMTWTQCKPIKPTIFCICLLRLRYQGSYLVFLGIHSICNVVLCWMLNVLSWNLFALRWFKRELPTLDLILLHVSSICVAECIPGTILWLSVEIYTSLSCLLNFLHSQGDFKQPPALFTLTVCLNQC